MLKLLALVMNHFSQVEFRGFPILQGIEIAHDDDRRIGMLLLMVEPGGYSSSLKPWFFDDLR